MAQGGQGPSQAGNWTWQCHPCGASLRVLKDAWVKESWNLPPYVQLKTGQCMAEESLCGSQERTWGPERPLEDTGGKARGVIGDPKMSEVTEPWDSCQEEFPTRKRFSPRKKRLVCSQQQLEGELIKPFDARHGDIKFGFYSAMFWSCFGLVFHHYALTVPIWDGNVYSVPFYFLSMFPIFLFYRNFI